MSTRKPQPAAKTPAKTPAKATVAAPEPAARVLVIVGGQGAAGRIMLGQTVYDGFTPRWMARVDFERLQAQYDLQEAKPK